MERLSHKSQKYSSLFLRLENFRPFRDSGIFRLAPLTCLVGANSSGKSSIITSILLLKQSIERELLGSRASQLALNGPYCKLGSFADVVYNHKETLHLGFDFSIPRFGVRFGVGPH